MFTLRYNQTAVRSVYTLSLVAALFGLPWWFTTGLALLGLIVFPYYLESVFVGLAYDSVFAVSALPKLAMLTLAVFVTVTAVRLSWVCAQSK